MAEAKPKLYLMMRIDDNPNPKCCAEIIPVNLPEEFDPETVISLLLRKMQDGDLLFGVASADSKQGDPITCYDNNNPNNWKVRRRRHGIS